MKKKRQNNNFRFNNSGNAFLLGFASFYAINIIYEIIVTLMFGNNKPDAVEWCTYLTNPIAFIGIMLLYAKKKDVNVITATKLNKIIGFKQIGIIFLLSIFCIMAFLPITNIFLDLLSRLGFSMELSFADTTKSVGAYFLGLLLLAVVPALCEEFFMRGVILNCAEQKRDYSYAILITAGMFSLMHGNPIQTVHQFLLGMVLAYIVLVSRSLWAGILLHFFNNFWSLSLDYPFTCFLANTGLDKMNDGLKYVVWIITMLIGVTMVLYLLKKFTRLSIKKEDISSGEIIDVYEGRDGVYTTKKSPDIVIKERHNDLAQCFKDFVSIFKKGGLKDAYRKINAVLSSIVPEPEEQIEMTRQDFFPNNIKLCYVVLIIIWVLSLVLGFV